MARACRSRVGPRLAGDRRHRARRQPPPPHGRGSSRGRVPAVRRQPGADAAQLPECLERAGPRHAIGDAHRRRPDRCRQRSDAVPDGTAPHAVDRRSARRGCARDVEAQPRLQLDPVAARRNRCVPGGPPAGSAPLDGALGCAGGLRGVAVVDRRDASRRRPRGDGRRHRRRAGARRPRSSVGEGSGGRRLRGGRGDGARARLRAGARGCGRRARRSDTAQRCRHPSCTGVRWRRCLLGGSRLAAQSSVVVGHLRVGGMGRGRRTPTERQSGPVDVRPAHLRCGLCSGRGDLHRPLPARGRGDPDRAWRTLRLGGPVGCPGRGVRLVRRARRRWADAVPVARARHRAGARRRRAGTGRRLRRGGLRARCPRWRFRLAPAAQPDRRHRDRPRRSARHLRRPDGSLEPAGDHDGRPVVAAEQCRGRLPRALDRRPTCPSGRGPPCGSGCRLRHHHQPHTRGRRDLARPRQRGRRRHCGCARRVGFGIDHSRGPPARAVRGAVRGGAGRRWCRVDLDRSAAAPGRAARRNRRPTRPGRGVQPAQLRRLREPGVDPTAQCAHRVGCRGQQERRCIGAGAFGCVWCCPHHDRSRPPPPCVSSGARRHRPPRPPTRRRLVAQARRPGGRPPPRVRDHHGVRPRCRRHGDDRFRQPGLAPSRGARPGDGVDAGARRGARRAVASPARAGAHDERRCRAGAHARPGAPSRGSRRSRRAGRGRGRGRWGTDRC